jgi:hypothetical protein
LTDYFSCSFYLPYLYVRALPQYIMWTRNSPNSSSSETDLNPIRKSSFIIDFLNFL